MKEKKVPEELFVEILLLRNGEAQARSVSSQHDSGIQILRDKEQVYQTLYSYLNHKSKIANTKVQITRAQMEEEGLYMEAVHPGYHEKWYVGIPRITIRERTNPEGDYQRLNRFVQAYKRKCLQEELALGRAAMAKLEKQHIRNMKIRNALLETVAFIGGTLLLGISIVKGIEKTMIRDGYIPPEPTSSSSSTTTEKTSDEVLEEMINHAATPVFETESSKTL